MSRQEPDVIDSVEKALRVLQAFSAEHPSLTVSEAADLTGLARATARRVLLTYVQLGFAETDDRRFRLTPRVLRLGYGYLSSLPIWERAQPHMRALADEVRESCSAATLDGDEIVYVARVPAKRSMSIVLSVGSRLPAYPTSMGRVLLAAQPQDRLAGYLETLRLQPLTANTITDARELADELTRVREQGYALVNGEREEGVCSAAAPVRDGAGKVIAAVNVAANAGRVSAGELRERCVPLLIKTADAISSDIGYVSPD
jgi:IclR family pca regulon transcriptional regulator